MRLSELEIEIDRERTEMHIYNNIDLESNRHNVKETDTMAPILYNSIYRTFWEGQTAVTKKSSVAGRD